MTYSSSAIISGIMNNLNSSSVLGASNASTDYFILERSSACCAVVGLHEIYYVPNTYGNPRGGDFVTKVIVEGYIRDQNDPTKVMRDIAGFTDTMMNSLADDDTLGNSVDSLSNLTMRRNQGEAVSAGGTTWLPIYIEIESLKFK